MAITTLAILANTTYGTPSGNYDGSSLSFISDPQKAVDYYQGQGSIQTVFFHVTAFPGIIRLQATLDYEADQANWFELYEYGDGSTELTEYLPVTFTGNFTWVRVIVEQFDSGTINGVNISY